MNDRIINSLKADRSEVKWMIYLTIALVFMALCYMIAVGVSVMNYGLNPFDSDVPIRTVFIECMRVVGVVLYFRCAYLSAHPHRISRLKEILIMVTVLIIFESVQGVVLASLRHYESFHMFFAFTTQRVVMICFLLARRRSIKESFELVRSFRDTIASINGGDLK